MVYLAARALPRVGEQVLPSRTAKYFDELVKKIPLEKIDVFLSSLAEKLLRKSKILILKVDNKVTFYLNKFKSGTNGKEIAKPDLFETNTSEKQETEK